MLSKKTVKRLARDLEHTFDYNFDIQTKNKENDSFTLEVRRDGKILIIKIRDTLHNYHELFAESIRNIYKSWYKNE